MVAAADVWEKMVTGIEKDGGVAGVAEHEVSPVLDALLAFNSVYTKQFSFSDTFFRPSQQQCGRRLDLLVQEPQTCPQCGLPVGELGFVSADGKSHLHSECKAQFMLRAAEEDEASRQRKDAAAKDQLREKYSIGWKAERVPRNAEVAGKLGGSSSPEGMCCLLMDSGSDPVRVAPTDLPAASVNLEYLRLALQVRRQDGAEPFFSLDPLGGSANGRWQVKRFQPAWLAGTIVGEVMFQADMYLKELSMGEYSQPVLGMRSSLDHSTGEYAGAWSAREWFVVTNAEMCLVEGNVLIPQVCIGVEAREQVMGALGLEDAPLTQPDHPLVKYADAFTHNFDLIAERKSVIFQLREVAKASVLAKFLLEAEASLGVSWFDRMGDARTDVCMHVPQLWNARLDSEIHMQDGEIVEADTGIQAHIHSVYGGVEMRLDAFITKDKAALGQLINLKPEMYPAIDKRALSDYKPAAFFKNKRQPTDQARGVDLSLDAFDLSGAAATRRGLGPELKDSGDTQLLRDVFHPHLSDRQSEGHVFVPPDTSSVYMSKLRSLIQEEEAVREQRKQHFCSTQFVMGGPDALFPSSWETQFKVSDAQGSQSAELHARADLKAEAMFYILQGALPAPVFDKMTEDGTRFRIYQLGSLQCRTFQEPNGREIMGAVFSDLSSRTPTQGSAPRADERIAKVTQYVEHSYGGSGAAAQMPMGKLPSKHPHFYVVLETEGGSTIVTEKLAGKAAIWDQTPSGLEVRNSLAKAIRSADCRGAGITVRDLKGFQGVCGVDEECQQYAEGAYNWAVPARQRRWSTLTDAQQRAAKQLGVNTAAKWDAGSPAAFRLAWRDLLEFQREAAQQLGWDQAAWDKAEGQAH